MSNKRKHTPGPMPVSDIGKSLPELVSLGCKFVVPGELFQTTIGLVEKLMTDGAGDKQAMAFLLELRTALLETSVPVKSKIGDEHKLIVPETKIVIPQ